MQRQTTCFAAFATAHHQRARREIKVAELDITGFLDAYSGVHEQCEQGLITQAQPGIRLSACSAQQGIHSLLWKRARRDGRGGNVWDLPGGILHQQPLLDCPGAKTAQRRETAINGCRGGSFVLLTNLFPRTQITFHHLRQIESTLAGSLPPGAKLREVGSDSALSRKRLPRGGKRRQILFQNGIKHAIPRVLSHAACFRYVHLIGTVKIAEKRSKCNTLSAL